MSWLSGRLASFGHALRGIGPLLAGEANAQIHALATVGVVVLAFSLDVSAVGWALLVLALALVWAAEGMNAAIEALADRVWPEEDPAIGRAKDVAAGAVLLAAIGAAGVGFIVLGPPLWRLVTG